MKKPTASNLRQALLAGLLLLPAQAQPAGLASRSTTGISTDREVTDAQIVSLIERSEAGDIDGLQEARGSTSDPVKRAIIDARLAASRLDLARVRAALTTVRMRQMPPAWRAIGLATEAGAAFAVGDYRLCGEISNAWLEMPEGTDPIHGRADIQQMGALAEQLANLTRQTVLRQAPGSSATWRDKATLVRTNVVVDGRTQEMVIDTGANLSVVTETTARNLGLKTADGGSVRSSSRGAVSARVTVAKRLDIAGTTLANVVFLVMKDADLRLPLPGGYDIPAIIGLPVLRALGRVTFTPTTLSTGRSQIPAVAGAPLVASGSDLFVLATVNGAKVPLHLDSGASNTTLGSRFAADNPDVVRSLGGRSSRSAGAGGAIESTVHVLREAVVYVGAVSTRLSAIDVEMPNAAITRTFGTLGQDVLRSEGGGYTVDFKRMTLMLERPPTPSR